MHEIFDYSIFGNSVYGYAEALGILIGGIITVLVFKKYILRHLIKWTDSTDTKIDDLLVKTIQKSLIPVFY